MMVHLEGHIVDSIYDNILISYVALISRRTRGTSELTPFALNSWNNSLSPSLPCLAVPSPYSSKSPEPFTYTFSDSNIYLAQIDVAKAAKAARILLGREDAKAKKGEQKDRLSPPEWWGRESTPNTPGIAGGGHHRLTWFGGSGSTTPEDGEGGGEHGGGRFAGLVMQLVEKAREEKARLALGMGGTQGRDVSTSPSGAAGVSTSPHGQVAASLDTPGEAPTQVPASYTEGRASVADSGVELQSKKSDKSVADARRAAEQHEMQDLRANGVTSQDFEENGLVEGHEKEALKLDTGGTATPSLFLSAGSECSPLIADRHETCHSFAGRRTSRLRGRRQSARTDNQEEGATDDGRTRQWSDNSHFAHFARVSSVALERNV